MLEVLKVHCLIKSDASAASWRSKNTEKLKQKLPFWASFWPELGPCMCHLTFPENAATRCHKPSLPVPTVPTIKQDPYRKDTKNIFFNFLYNFRQIWGSRAQVGCLRSLPDGLGAPITASKSFRGGCAISRLDHNYPKFGETCQ